MEIGFLLLVFQPLDMLSHAWGAYGGAWVIAAGTLLLAALGVATLRATFPRGGDRHSERHLRDAAAGGLAPDRGHASSRLGAWIYLRCYLLPLDRDSTAGWVAVRARAGRMLVYALGPGAHGGGQLVLTALMLLVSLAVAWLGGRQRHSSTMQVMMALALTMPLIYHVLALRIAMYRYRAEQSLLRLAPAAPSARELNRVLGRQLLCFAVLNRSGSFDMLALQISALALGGGVLLLRDYAASRPVTEHNRPLTGALYLAGLPLLLGLVLALLPSPWHEPGKALLIAVTAIAWGALRWRRMQAAPPAFPAGRLAP